MKIVDQDLKDNSIFRVVCSRCNSRMDLEYEEIFTVWENQWQMIFSQCGICGRFNSYPIAAVHQYLLQLGMDVQMPVRTMDVTNNNLNLGISIDEK